MMQYRITFNGTEGPITEHIDSERWSRCVDVAEQRGLYARLERRLITDRDILPLLEDPKGYMQIDNLVICPWEILAEAAFASQTEYVGS
jgi:hypothetical protein